MVSSFYDLVTDFYEYGWGQSFHFAPRFTHETFTESIYRAEHFLALKLGLSSSKKCVDVGCGVGGPMRNIARFTGADITGVTINEYQVKVGNRYCKEQGVDDICRSTQVSKGGKGGGGMIWDVRYGDARTKPSPTETPPKSRTFPHALPLPLLSFPTPPP